MPVAIPLLIGITAAGAATQAVGAIKAGNAQQRAGAAQQAASNDQASLQDYNASVADLQAKDAIDRGAQEEHRFRADVAGMIGTQRVGIAAGNIDTGFGSAVDVQAETAHQGELDALRIRTNAAREAWGYKVQAEDLRRGAAITRQTGVNQELAGEAQQSASRFSAVGSILGAAGSVTMLGAKYGFAGS
jgi:hypothetical protein